MPEDTTPRSASGTSGSSSDRSRSATPPSPAPANPATPAAPRQPVAPRPPVAPRTPVGYGNPRPAGGPGGGGGRPTPGAGGRPGFRPGGAPAGRPALPVRGRAHRERVQVEGRVVAPVVVRAVGRAARSGGRGPRGRAGGQNGHAAPGGLNAPRAPVLAKPTGPVAIPNQLMVKDLADLLGASVNEVIRELIGVGTLPASTRWWATIPPRRWRPSSASSRRKPRPQRRPQPWRRGATPTRSVRRRHVEDAHRVTRPRSSPSWATWTTARRRCSTPFATRAWRRARRAASRSTSAPIRSKSTGARSPSSTRRATRRSPPCARAAPR